MASSVAMLAEDRRLHCERTHRDFRQMAHGPSDQKTSDRLRNPRDPRDPRSTLLPAAELHRRTRVRDVEEALLVLLGVKIDTVTDATEQ